MQFHDGTADFLKMFWVGLLLIGLVAWLHVFFSPTIALIALVILAGTVFVVIGILLSAFIQKNTLNGVTDYAAKDAMTDRYRMQTMKELVNVEKEHLKANVQKIKTDEQIRLLEYKGQQKQLPDSQEDTFWEANETIDLEDWN